MGLKHQHCSLSKKSGFDYPVVRRELRSWGYSYFLLNWEPRSYLEFPNHLVVDQKQKISTWFFWPTRDIMAIKKHGVSSWGFDEQTWGLEKHEIQLDGKEKIDQHVETCGFALDISRRFNRHTGHLFTNNNRDWACKSRQDSKIV